jgi:YidC/Oxa1 family membrane protein insertase
MVQEKPMEQQPVQGMWGRYVLFIVLSLGILLANVFLTPRPSPPPKKAQERLLAKEGERKEKDAAGQEPAKAAKEPDRAKPGAEKAKAKAPAAPPAAEPAVPEAWVTLGSLNPKSPYRMLVTLTNRGAAVHRIELNNPRFRDLEDFHDLEDRSGYLGHVVGDELAPGAPGAAGAGVLVRVVGEGTPAAEAKLQPERDAILALDGQEIRDVDGLRAALGRTKPKDKVVLTVRRQQGEKQQPIELDVPVTLERRPLDIVGPDGWGSDGRPVTDAPPSFRLGILPPELVDQLKKEPGRGRPADALTKKAANPDDPQYDPAKLRSTNWEIVAHDQEHVQFRRSLPQWDLEVLKTFRLARVPDEKRRDSSHPSYHLTLEVEIRNTGKAARDVAYELDGPNGLPAEGWWYASKVGRAWSSIGLRDVIFALKGKVPELVSPAKIGSKDADAISVKRPQSPMTFLGVDGQYFCAVLIPQREDPDEVWLSEWQPLCYGVFDKQRPTLINTSFRVTSKVHEALKPNEKLHDTYTVFTGPRNPDLLQHYGLKDVVYYGWYWWAAIPLLWVLHGVYYVIPNYGVAIVVLTVLVRGAMFPLSRKQALGAQKMAEIQPELKRIQEKYKNDLEARGKAQQELFRKHNYNPMGGCLIALLQLPIFVGLYRALMVDVKLHQAPLIPGLPWASNLAAPDMLFDWSGLMPEFITRGTGILGLGPCFNLLPVFAIGLFLWQQKKMMPPPADEQAAMQQKMMKWMMIFMGVLFFKVASGLCLYFIASSLWGIGERKFLPKAAAAGTQAVAKVVPRAVPGRGPGGRDGSGPRKKKSPRR